MRQINVDKDINVHVHLSCLEDCLAEGIIEENELDGTIKLITQFEFDEKWNKAKLKKRKLRES